MHVAPILQAKFSNLSLCIYSCIFTLKFIFNMFHSVKASLIQVMAWSLGICNPVIKEKTLRLTMTRQQHYCNVIMGTMAFQITSLTTVYSTFYSGADQRKQQSSPSLAFVRAIHQWPVNSPHKRPVRRKMFPFDDVIMNLTHLCWIHVEWSTTVLPTEVCLILEILW